VTRALLGAVVAALAASALAAAPSAAAVRMTHSLTIEGEFVNHWTMSDPNPCGVNGDGTLTVKFKTVRPVRVLPRVFPFIRGQVGGYGAWMIAVPLPPNLLRDMPGQRISGTVDRVDNTTQRPPLNPDDPCDPPDVGKQGCGTTPLRGRGRPPIAGVGRWNRRRTSATMSSSSFLIRSCNSGSAEGWSDTTFAGDVRKGGVLLLDMPRPSAFKNRRVVRATGTSRKRASDELGDQITTNDVTRKLTATFRRR
jgi:hypothetical protein